MISRKKAQFIRRKALQGKSQKGRVLQQKQGQRPRSSERYNRASALFADQTDESPLMVAAHGRGAGDKGSAGYLEEERYARFSEKDLIKEKNRLFGFEAF